MKWKLKFLSVTTILVLVILVALLFRVEIPLCYNTFEERQKEAFVLYDIKIVDTINQEIEESPFYYIRINGNSMIPSINHGDMCVCIPQNNYYQEDIISFFVPVEDKVELIAHRITKELEGDRFTTRGDNNNIEDTWIITEDQIFCQIPEKNLFNKFRFAVVESGGKFNIFSIFG
jgi:signal peptidase I